MFLSQLVLDPTSRDVRRDLANAYDLHRTLMAAYPHGRDPHGRAEVLYRVEPTRGGPPVVLVQSLQRPDWSRLTGGYAADVHGPKSLDGVRFLAGQHLRFRLRANPTKRLRETSVGTGGAPVGPAWAEKRVGLVREDDQRAWLERKAEAAGFRLLDVRLAPEGNAVARKADRPLTFTAVLFDGRLEVTDADRFRAAWAAGIGSAKGLGFGLLTVAAA